MKWGMSLAQVRKEYAEFKIVPETVEWPTFTNGEMKLKTVIDTSRFRITQFDFDGMDVNVPSHTPVVAVGLRRLVLGSCTVLLFHRRQAMMLNSCWNGSIWLETYGRKTLKGSVGLESRFPTDFGS